VLRQSIGARLANQAKRSSSWGWLALALGFVWTLTQANDFEQVVAGTVLIYAIAALGLDWLQGRAGLVSIGTAAFLAVGGYTTATVADKADIGVFPIPILLSGVAGAVVGLIAGLPAVRLRGIYLALSTLALQFITIFAAQQYETRSGHLGGFVIPQASIGDFTLQYGTSFLVALTVILLLAVAALRVLYRRPPGRAWAAIRESDLAASALGINATRARLSAFVGSSALIAIAGSLLAYYTQAVTVDVYSLDLSIVFVVMIIVGGTGSMAGAFIGATVVTISPYLLTTLTGYLPTDLSLTSWITAHLSALNNGLYGILLLVFVLYQPKGAVFAVRRLRNYGLRQISRWNMGWPPRLRARTALAVPDTTADTLAVTRPMFSIADDPVPAEVPNGHHGSAGAGERPTDSVLSITNVSLTYGNGARALSGVSVEVPPACIVALLGRNGAGKTSLLRSVAGFFKSENARLEGSVRLRGHEIIRRSPIAAARHGVVYVPERDKVHRTLTVREHFGLIPRAKRADGDALDLFPALRSRLDVHAGLLSGGERQMLAIAVALSRRPDVLLIDELSLGLAPVITKELLGVVRRLPAQRGISVLLVEQNAHAALEVADYVYVLEGGTLIIQGRPEALLESGQVKTAYLGAEVAAR
jgi:branched-chain amino acid transport system permease protein